MLVLIKTAPSYYRQIEIGINKIHFFLIGIFAGSMSYNNKSIVWYWIPITVLLLVVSYLMFFPGVVIVRETLIRFVGITICCFVLSRNFAFNSLLKWCGIYSLELYIFHMLFRSLYVDFVTNVVLGAILPILSALLICKPVHNLIDNYILKLIK